MAYDRKADYGKFMGGVEDYSNATIAKRLVDKKRKALEGGGELAEAADAGGTPTPDDMGGEAPLGGEEASPDLAPDAMENAESPADEAMESPADQSMEAASGTEQHEKVMVEVTPEELAQLEMMRSGKA